MRHIRACFVRLGAFFRRRQHDRALDAEIQAHVQLHIDDNIRGGMTPEAARRNALMALGGVGVTKEHYRRRRGVPWLEELVQDLRYATRVLRRSPAFALTAVVSLTLGIGANTLIFSVVNALVLRPLPAAQPHELVFLQRVGGGGFPTFSFPVYRDLRQQNATFDDLVGYRMSPMEVETAEGPVRTWGYLATGNYFDVLGIKPRLGRFFRGSDDQIPGAAPFAVLSYDYWSAAFAADPSIVGSTIRINRASYTVIGVAPEEFNGTEIFYRPQIWVPMMMQAQIEPGNAWLENRNTANTFVLGRLKPKVSAQAAEANLNAVTAEIARQDPRARGIQVRLAKPGLIGDMLRRPVQAFALGVLVLVGLVLLTSCANVTIAAAARAVDRQREMAIRISLGAGRFRLIRFLLAETAVLALIGGVAAFALASGGLQALSRWQLPLQAAIQFDVRPDVRVFMFALGVCVMAAALTGLAPIRLASHLDPNVALKTVGGVSARRRLPMRDLLVGIQVTLCCVLVVACLLALRGLERMAAMPLGFQPAGLTTVAFELGLAGYSRDDGMRFQSRVLDAIDQLPGVESAAYANSFPLSIDRSTTTVYAEDRPEDRGISNSPVAVRYTVSPGFFRTLQIPFLNGRDFDQRDSDTAPRVAIVNETFAREVLRSDEPIGRLFRYGPRGAAIQVVGVVANGKYSTLTETSQPVVFDPTVQSYNSTTVLLVRSSLPDDTTLRQIRQAVTSIDPSLPLYDTGSVERILNFAFLPNRVAAVTLGAFGVLAVVLAASGIYGVMAYAVARRRREIGIRMALGATKTAVIRLVASRMLAIVCAGTIIGLLGAVAASRVLTNVVYLANPNDPAVVGGAILVMALVGIAASWFPMAQSLKTQPVVALRSE